MHPVFEIVLQKLADCLSYESCAKFHPKIRDHICLLQKHHDYLELSVHIEPSLQALLGIVDFLVNIFLFLVKLLAKSLV